MLVSLPRKPSCISRTYSTISNKVWDRRLWSKEGKALRRPYQNQEQYFSVMLSLPPKSRISHYSFSCFTYHFKSYSCSWNILSASPLTSYLLQEAFLSPYIFVRCPCPSPPSLCHIMSLSVSVSHTHTNTH